MIDGNKHHSLSVALHACDVKEKMNLKLVTLIMGKKNDSVMLLGLLANYSIQKEL